MTMCSMYVGDLEKFDWRGDWNGNLPPRLTPPFPPMAGNYHYHSKFEEWVEKTGVFSAQVDFDGYVAKVTKAQILKLIAECYDSDPSYTNPKKMLRWEGKAYLVEKLDALKRAVAGLEDDREYGLVSECF